MFNHVFNVICKILSNICEIKLLSKMFGAQIKLNIEIIMNEWTISTLYNVNGETTIDKVFQLRF